MSGLRNGAVLLVLAAVMTVSMGSPSRAADDAKAWIAAFRAIDAARADALIDDFRQRKDPAIAPILFAAALDASHAHLAVAAGDALRELGQGSIDLDAAVTAAAALRGSGQRRNLVRVLAAWGRSKDDGLMARLAEDRSEAQEEALFGCGAVLAGPGEFPATAAAIGRALDDAKPELRVAACAGASRRGLSALGPRLLDRLLNDEGTWVAHYAVLALERLNTPIRLADLLRALSGNPKIEARDAVLRGIAVLTRIEDVDTLVPLLARNDADVAHAAVLALARLGLERSGPPATPAPIATLPPTTRASVGAALLDVATKSPTMVLRTAAVRALEASGPTLLGGLESGLVDLLGRPDEDVRLIGMRLCGAGKVERARPAMLDLLLADLDPAARCVAARAFATLEPKRATDDLLRVVRTSADTAKVRRAIAALGYVRDEAGVHGLVEHLADPKTSAANRAVAEEALERLTAHRFGPQAEAWGRWLAQTSAVFPRPLPALHRAAHRAEVTRSGLYGASRAAEPAVERALGWLERNQGTNGSWVSLQRGWGGAIGQPATYTGLCLMAFTGAGYHPARGRYRESVWRAADFLAAAQRFDGRASGFAPNTIPPGERIRAFDSYVSFGACWGLIDVHAVDPSGTWREPAQRGVDRILAATQPVGWWNRRYEEDPSLTTMAFAAYALNTGRWAGLRLADSALDGTDVYLRSASSDVAGLVETSIAGAVDPSVTVGGDATHDVIASDVSLSATQRAKRKATHAASLTELAAASRALEGWPRSHPFLVGCGNFLQRFPPMWLASRSENAVVWFHDYAWWGSMAMFQVGGKPWRVWGDTIRQLLPSH